MAQKKMTEQKSERDVAVRYLEYAKVIIHLVTEGSTEAAESYVDDLLKVCTQTSSKALHHSLIHACSKLGNPATAVWCALRMVRSGLKPNVVTFNALLDTAAKSGDTNLATRLWDLMGESGLSPNSITYNTMMNVFAKTNDAELAEHWLLKMLADGIPTCAVSFQTVIAAYAKRGEYEKAEAWFHTMKESGVKPDRAIYNSMIWAKSSHPQHFEHWLLEMESSGLVPDDKAYMTMVNLWSRTGLPDRAKLWLRKMDRRGLKANKQTVAAVLDSCLRHGDEAFARELLDRMSGPGSSDVGVPPTSASSSVRAPTLSTPAPKQASSAYFTPYYSTPCSPPAYSNEAAIAPQPWLPPPIGQLPRASLDHPHCDMFEDLQFESL